MKKRSILKRALSFIMAFCMLVTVPYMVEKTASANSGYDKIVDPSTIDSWKDFFGENVLNTENAGGVWTDKSVFSTDEYFAKYGISLDDESDFLVALSLIASNKSVSGLSNVPTDTMLVLDLSSSMYPSLDPSTVNTMVDAVNKTVTDLQALNIHNRVGVVVYFGGSTLWESTSACSNVILPLDRYTHQNNKFIKTTTTNGGSSLVSVDVNDGVKNSGNNPVFGSHKVETVAGTYAQLGILDGMNQFLREDIDPKIPASSEYQAGVTRVPVMILMSDGEPTAATNNYTKKEDFKMGNNQVASRNPAETDFVTQLTAAYAKERIDRRYADTTPLFYTLSLGGSISMDIMDPKSNDALSNQILSGTDGKTYTDEEIQKAQNNQKIKEYWNSLLTYGEVDIKVQNYNQNSYSAKTEYTHTVRKVVINTDGDGVLFPRNAEQKYYVDESFTAENAGSLSDAFSSIVNKIALQSRYFPTLVEGKEDLDGYITFTDLIGKYMNVTDIKGIVIGDVLFSGAELSSNFVDGGGELGTITNPSALGKEMVAAVQSRLGISDIGVAAALIGEAYKEGQLRYSSPDDFSNYIGWYANSKGEFLGFWHENIETMPSPDDETIPVDERPAYIIKSYGYLGEVDEEQGVSDSDMMYAAVQVRTNIKSGEQAVIFSVPASLVPMTSYDITLDENGNLSEFSAGGAKSPMSLVYEVGLNDNINEVTLNDENVVDKEYIKANKNPDGSVNFYTNQYEVDNTTGYGKVNTYSYFRPSHQNEKYYFQENTYIYVNNGGKYERYSAENAPDVNGEFYQAVKVYSAQDGLEIKYVYSPLSHEALSVAQRDSKGEWYVPVGTVHVNLSGYQMYKSSNNTNTLTETFGDNDPTNDKGLAKVYFVDIEGHTVNEVNHSFVVGATLGNNGKITVVPATGIKLSKTVEGAESDAEFLFEISSENERNGKYDGIKTSADGTKINISVEFVNGVATVSLKNGESIVITGLSENNVYVINEAETVEYVVKSVNGNASKKNASVKVEKNKITDVSFVNAPRAKGNLTVTKTVEHELGTNYDIPEDKAFEISVSLSGVGSKNATYKVAHSGNNALEELTTDKDGKFPVVLLKHDEQIEFFDLPVGITATVVENTPPVGFTATYRENGAVGDGEVVISTVPTSVEVVNAYDHGNVNGNKIKINGTKFVKGENGDSIENWGDAEFVIVLEKHGANGWTEIDRKTVNNENRTFSFNLSSETYSAPGVYSYQLYELIPAESDRISGMLYDRVYHTFSVVVEDADMENGLEISKIHSEHADKEFEKDENGVWTITTNFTNVQYDTVPAAIVIPVQKVLVNESGSTLVSLAHNEFALYKDAECTVLLEAVEGIQKIELSPTDAVGEAIIEVIFDTVGEYKFYLKEVNKGVSGMIYDETVVEINVLVTSSGVGGKLVSEVKYDTDLVDGEIVFTNKYVVTDATVELDVRKELSGRDLTENDKFTFEIRENGKTVLSGVNRADGKVIFDGKLTFSKVGVYNYTVVETSQNGKGITVDTSVYNVRITVFDKGDGSLGADVSVAQVVGNTITFKNSYSAKETEWALDGNKILVGRPLLNDEFTFVMAECDADGNVSENVKTFETKNYTDGHFQFGKIKYYAVGEYHYLLWEKPESVLNGIKFDNTKYLVTVNVMDDGVGSLYTSVEYKILGGDKVSVVKFVNEYSPSPATAFIPGTKHLEGKVLGNGQFTFVLLESDEKWNEGNVKETVFNDEEGRITFTDIEYDKVGTYYYIVKEVYDQITKDGITYDDTVYRVRIDITDDLKGYLHSAVHIFDGDNVPKPGVYFVNKYDAKPAEVEIGGNKELIGRPLEDGEFTFALYEADEAFSIVNQNALLETVNKADGIFAFDKLVFENEGTYNYVVLEKESDADRITFDDTVYCVSITVADNGEGALIANDVKISVKDGDEAESISFKNVFTPKPDDISIEIIANKTVRNIGTAQIGADGFEFVLENIESGEKIAARSDEFGKAVFKLDFSENDIGKTYNYTLSETDEGMENVVYSKEVYNISVSIALSEDNEIIATVSEDGEKTPVSIFGFENIYNHTPPGKPGDSMESIMWMLLMILSAMGIAFVVFKKRKA